MSGYNYDCDYKRDYDYNDCYKPRHHRRHRNHHGCWDYNSYCN